MPARPFRPLALLAVAALTTSLAACSTDDTATPPPGGTSDESVSPTEQAAPTEESVVVYVGRDEELVGPLLEQFSTETGIQVDARYAGTTEHLALLLEEGEQTPADVFLSQDAGALGALADAGATETLPAEITDAVLPDFTSTDGSWVGITGRARVIAYDSRDLDVAEVPTTVEGLTAPEWSGRVGLPPGNASFQAFVTGFRTAEGDDAARAWLQGMADNDLQTFASNGDTLEALEAGVIDVGLINHYYSYALAAEVGEENVFTELVFPDADDPGALVNVTGAAKLSDSAAADTLIAYLVSAAGQEYFVENTFEYPVVDGVAAPAGLPALSTIEGPVEDLSDLADLEASIAMIEEVGLS